MNGGEGAAWVDEEAELFYPQPEPRASQALDARLGKASHSQESALAG